MFKNSDEEEDEAGENLRSGSPEVEESFPRKRQRTLKVFFVHLLFMLGFCLALVSNVAFLVLI